MAKLTVEMVTAEGRTLSSEADFVSARGIEGEFGVLPNHIPLLTVLRPGEVMVRNGADEQYFFVSGGFIEVTADKVVILADAAEHATDIDAERAEQARHDAEEALKQNEGDAAAAASLERAVYRLRVSELRRHKPRHSSGPSAQN